MNIVPTPEGFQIVPEAWAVDQPNRNTNAARSWAELADICDAQAAWTAMVLETRQIDLQARELLVIEHGTMREAVAVYRQWAAQNRPFRSRADDEHGAMAVRRRTG